MAALALSHLQVPITYVLYGVLRRPHWLYEWIVEWLMQLSCTWILILRRPKFSISMPVKVHLLLLPAAALPRVVIHTFQNSSIIIIILDGDSAPALTCRC